MTEPKKLSTAEILALARQKKAGSAEGSAPPADAAPAAEASASTEPAAAAAEAAPAAKPKSTADILAAARAAKAGGPAAGGEAATPKSTADILAAARASGGSAAATPKPSSTADILAAARAAKAGGGGAAQPGSSTATAAAEKGTAKPSVPAGIAGLPPGEKPSVEQMLKAVRAGKPAEAPKPKLPSKAPASAKAAKVESRRSFFDTLFSPFYLGFGLLAAWGGIGSLAMARFMMPNTVLELPSRFKVGSTGDYPLGTVSEKYKASRGVWIVHTDSYDGRNILYALSSVCTHLGCTPNWLDAEQKFKCPCHGSGFYINGINFEGPAPRPLERVGLRVAEDGQLEVDKSVKFQEELGQWSDEKSFVSIA
jgi:cytochrome b6-f complex iron-sulfur subunit